MPESPFEQEEQQQMIILHVDWSKLPDKIADDAKAKPPTAPILQLANEARAAGHAAYFQGIPRPPRPADGDVWALSFEDGWNRASAGMPAIPE